MRETRIRMTETVNDQVQKWFAVRSHLAPWMETGKRGLENMFARLFSYDSRSSTKCFSRLET